MSNVISNQIHETVSTFASSLSLCYLIEHLRFTSKIIVWEWMLHESILFIMSYKICSPHFTRAMMRRVTFTLDMVGDNNTTLSINSHIFIHKVFWSLRRVFIFLVFWWCETSWCETYQNGKIQLGLDKWNSNVTLLTSATYGTIFGRGGGGNWKLGRG